MIATIILTTHIINYQYRKMLVCTLAQHPIEVISNETYRKNIDSQERFGNCVFTCEFNFAEVKEFRNIFQGERRMHTIRK